MTDPGRDEWEILTTEAGRALLAEVAAERAPGPAEMARWRRSTPSGLVSAAIRLAEGRRRGAAKFPDADRLWTEPVAVEQATADAVARHKAARFAGAVVVDLCSGIGGDALAIAEVARAVVAVDLDPTMPRRVLWNARARGLDGRLLAARGRAESTPIPAGALVHVDPDRRADRGGGPRARAVADYRPGLGFLRGLPTTARGGAVKLGPASDFDDHFAGLGEVELVSLGGECKEATIWFGDLARGARRATALPSGASWTDRDAPAGLAIPAGPVDAWAFDPDPALRRSGLLGGFAARHGLRRVAPGVDVLTGPSRVDSGLLAPFEVVATGTPDRRRLRALVAGRRIGRIDVKTRGLEVRPEAVRSWLDLDGPAAAVLFLYEGGAILARRPEGPG